MFQYARRGPEPAIIQDGNYFYWKKSSYNSARSGQTSYIQCKFNKHPYWRCGARGRYINGQVILSPRHNQHTCHPTRELVQVKEFRDALLAAAQRDPRRIPYAVYQEVSRQYPESVVILCPYETIRPSLQRWISSSRPRVSRNFTEYFDTLMSDEWREKYTRRGSANLTVHRVQGTDNSSTIIYTDIELTQQLHQSATTWGIDATFKVCPKKPKMRQFLTIMALVHDEWIPFAWAIMTNKTIAAYRSLFTGLRNICGDILRPDGIMIDFEDALRAVLVDYFPNAEIYHCHFHHSQAIVKRLGIEKGKKRVYEALKAWPRGRLFMRKLLALALLPAQLIRHSFYHLIATADDDIITYFRNLLEYYRRHWLGRVGPHVYSLYNQRHRTNNPLESYHNLLATLFIGYRRNIWLFTDCIMDLVIKSRNEFLSLERGLVIRRRRENAVTRGLDMVDRAWEIFIRNVNPVQVDKFLTAVSHIYPSFGTDLVCTDVNQIDNFMNVNNYDDIVQMFPEIHHYEIDVDGIVTIYHRTGCLQCRCRFLANCVMLPCYHSFGCEQCFNSRLRICNLLNINLTCNTCGIVPHTMIIVDRQIQIAK